MLEIILKLYTTAMALNVRSPLPHLYGPPGCGKSSSVAQAAELLGVKLHIINVARISPLELEGIQMPVENNTKLSLLLATFWTQLKEGDILLLDEFLRGFPEVYNGLLDILTSREVAGHKLPKVFIIAASNSTAAYDQALTDRLLHIPVPDPRSSKMEDARQREMLVNAVGLLPSMVNNYNMETLMNRLVCPMYTMLDDYGKNLSQSGSTTGTSMRKLIGQAQLRHIEAPELKALLDSNNAEALRVSQPQHVVLPDGKDHNFNTRYMEQIQRTQVNKFNTLQTTNLTLNLQLIQLEKTLTSKLKKEEEDDELDELFE